MKPHAEASVSFEHSDLCLNFEKKRLITLQDVHRVKGLPHFSLKLLKPFILLKYTTLGDLHLVVLLCGNVKLDVHHLHRFHAVMQFLHLRPLECMRMGRLLVI